MADINVDLDLSVVAQLLLFATFVVLLKPILFDPLLRLFEAREKRTEGAREEAREMDAEAAELIARYEAELEQVRREAAEERDQLREQTSKLEAAILGEARARAADILARGEARIEEEAAALRKQLEGERPRVAAEIASRVLGREVSP